jgi:hypothetical protein
LVSFSRKPDRARIRHSIGQAEAEEAHERQAVVDQELAALIGQGVGGLDDQHLEHHHRIEWRPAAARTVGIRQGAQKFGAEELKIHRAGKTQQLIAQSAQPPQPIVDIKETALLRHRVTSSGRTQRIRKRRATRG